MYTYSFGAWNSAKFLCVKDRRAGKSLEKGRNVSDRPFADFRRKKMSLLIMYSHSYSFDWDLYQSRDSQKVFAKP